MIYRGFVGQSYTLQNTSAECQRTINLYPQVDETGLGKNDMILLSTPGLKTFFDAETVPGFNGLVRGMYVASNGRFFFVMGNNFFELRSDGTEVTGHAMDGESGSTTQVSMTDNGQDLMLVDGPNGYIFNFAAFTFEKIIDPSFFGADSVGFINGFFAWNQPGTQIFWWCGPYSSPQTIVGGDAMDPLNFASAEGSPDLLLSLLVDHGEIWLFGQTSTEVWYGSGDATSTFARVPGAFITHGLAAVLSPQRLDNTVFWLGNDDFGTGIVWRANGYSPVRVSTHALEQEMQRYPTIADATSYTYQQDGHSFYVLNFPSGNATWVYDAATNMWHQRAYLLPGGSLGRGRPNAHCFAFGKHLVGDFENGKIYEMSPAFLDDDGREIARVRRAPVINNENRRITFRQFELACSVGQGSADGTAPVDPQIVMRFSDDGGYTWSNENPMSLGKAGQYMVRVVWRRLGKARQRVFEVKVTDKVAIALYNAYLELEADAS